MNVEPTGKSTEEQFYDEATKAVNGNDSAALALLMKNDDTEDEDTTPEPIEEVPAEEDESPTETDGEEDAPESDDEDDDDASGDPDPDVAIDAISQLRKQLNEAKQLEHKLKSDAGRVPGLQRKMSELSRKLAEISANTEVNNASITDALNTESMDLIRKTDPVLAQALEETFKKVMGQMSKQSIETTQEVTNTFIQAQREESMQTEMGKLLTAVPNAREVFRSEEWSEWLETRSPGMRGLAKSDYADEVLVALREFSNSFEQPVATKKPAPSAVVEQRTKRLQVQTPGSTRVAPKRNSEVDEKSVFNKIYEDLLAQNKRR